MIKITIGDLRRLIKEELANLDENPAQPGSILASSSVSDKDLATAFNVDPAQLHSAITRLKSDEKKVDDSSVKKVLSSMGFNVVNSNPSALNNIIAILRRAAAAKPR